MKPLPAEFSALWAYCLSIQVYLGLLAVFDFYMLVDYDEQKHIFAKAHLIQAVL